jgi:hypothetical protein
MGRGGLSYCNPHSKFASAQCLCAAQRLSKAAQKCTHKVRAAKLRADAAQGLNTLLKFRSRPAQ